jgi:hypothetical protein
MLEPSPSVAARRNSKNFTCTNAPTSKDFAFTKISARPLLPNAAGVLS